MMIIYLYSPQDLDYNSIDPRFSTYLIIEYFVESRKSTRKDTPPPCWRMFSIPFSPVDSCTLGTKVIIIFFLVVWLYANLYLFYAVVIFTFLHFACELTPSHHRSLHGYVLVFFTTEPVQMCSFVFQWNLWSPSIRLSSTSAHFIFSIFKYFCTSVWFYGSMIVNWRRSL